MAFMNWATHVLQCLIQKAAIKRFKANPKIKRSSDYRLKLIYMKLESLVIVNHNRHGE